MMRLTREVRFAITNDYSSKITNSWSGWPATTRIVPQLKLTCTVEGKPDPATGYVCNIKELDDLIRQVVTKHVIPDFRSGESAELLLQRIYLYSQKYWRSHTKIVQLTLAINSCLKFSIRSESETMVGLTQQFEFSAAHRLHCNELSDKANLELFGKCNNPEGHGHNYVVEVSIDHEVDETGNGIDLPGFESAVKKHIIDRLDHKHLNCDVEYFAKVNPTVENIAIAIWNWLGEHIDNVKLSNVRVYETPKTWADYSG